MKTITKLRNRKAISPVIATVILVAVAISVSVGVSYWMSGIAGQYTSFEKIEIQTAICSWELDTATPADPAFGYWVIKVQLKNSGTATATLTNIFINDVEVDSYTHTLDGDGDPSTNVGQGLAATDMTETCTIESGETATVFVIIDGPNGVDTNPQWKKVSSGTTINLKIHSAGGLDYIRLVKLT